MINTFKLYEELSETLDDASARKLSSILGSFYEDFQNIVTKAEFTELKNTVHELAEAQKRTEARVNELAEAQKRTEETLQSLAVTVRDCQKQIGGLSMAVGYGIEDKIIPCMEDFAQKEYGITSRLVARRNIIYSTGEFDEINIYVEGDSTKGEEVLLIGECKAQPGKRDIDRFSELLDRIRTHYRKPVFGFLVGYTFPPDIDSYITEKYPDIKRYLTYEFGYRFSCKTAV